MKRNPVSLALLTLLGATLACTIGKPAPIPQQRATAPLPQKGLPTATSNVPAPTVTAIKPDPQACSATHLLLWESAVTKDTVNNLGTKACDYKLTLTTTHPNEAIWPVVYHHHADGYQNIDESEWQVLVKIDSNQSVDWFGNVYLYQDKDASGPVMNTVEEIAGIFATPECEAYRFDKDFLERVATKIEPSCTVN